jgi:hypothetical protein
VLFRELFLQVFADVARAGDPGRRRVLYRFGGCLAGRHRPSWRLGRVIRLRAQRRNMDTAGKARWRKRRRRSAGWKHRPCEFRRRLHRWSSPAKTDELASRPRRASSIRVSRPNSRAGGWAGRRRSGLCEAMAAPFGSSARRAKVLLSACCCLRAAWRADLGSGEPARQEQDI